MNRSGLKRKAKSLATARRQVREYLRRERNRDGVVQCLVDAKTEGCRRREDIAIRTACNINAQLLKARYFEDWGFWDRLRYLLSPKSWAKGAGNAA